jgi:serine/threonine-protein kinase
MSSVSDRLATALADRYRIERELGAGGMATVYLAYDLKHERQVAIKVLRPELGHLIGADRFLQEIKTTARLRHPHILPLFDSGTVSVASHESRAGDDPAQARDSGHSAFVYYVTPWIEGGSLRDHLLRDGPLPSAEAIRLACEVADALDYAHGHGVIHRDIKPDNILLESGHAVVADFGIARAVSAAASGGTAAGSRLTEAGLALGTPAYMSPEQASGESVIDGRADIYALGAVLYEMLSGEPPFSGATLQAVIAAVLTRTPAPLKSSIGVSSEMGRAIGKALAKAPADRYASAALFAQALRQAEGDGDAATRRRRMLPLGVAAVLAAAVLALLWFRIGPRNSGPPPLATRLVQQTFDEAVEEWPAWAPGGDQFVFSRTVGGYRNLFVRQVATGVERRLTQGSKDDIQASWDPDGTRIAFVRSSLASGKLEPGDVLGWYSEGGDVWTVDLATGQTALLVSNAFSPSYAPDGKSIAVDASWGGGGAAGGGPRRIWIVDRNGRNPRQVSQDSSEAVVHMSPRWAPDGKRLVYRRVQLPQSDLVVLDLATGAHHWLTHDDVVDVNPAWSPSGRFIYFSSPRGGGLNFWRIAVSAAGTSASAPQQLTTGAGDDLEPSVSPDGKRVAFSISRIEADIWRLPLDPASGRPTGNPEPVVATTRVESRGAWAPDGVSIAFNSDRLGDMNLWLHPLDGGPDRQLTKGPGGDYQPNWSPNGATIAFFSARSGQNDIWTVNVADGALHRLTTDSGIHINPFYSPDGQRIAYQVDRDGRFQPWVMNADGSGQRQLASDGANGHFMRWSADGESVIFRAEPPGGTQIQSINVRTGEMTALPAIAGGSHMSFAPDHRRILDVKGHKVVWITPLDGGAPYQVFEFPDPSIRIDYPVWSPDGRFMLFDHDTPRGGDIWLLDGVE